MLTSPVCSKGRLANNGCHFSEVAAMQLDQAEEIRQRLAELCREHSFSPPHRFFDASPVPDGLRHLVPLAQIWGQESALDREAIRDATPPAIRKFVAEALYSKGVQEQFAEWLAGPEAASGIESGEFSDAYLAFTYLNEAGDYFS
jgi:hypothetical protein